MARGARARETRRRRVESASRRTLPSPYCTVRASSAPPSPHPRPPSAPHPPAATRHAQRAPRSPPPTFCPQNNRTAPTRGRAPPCHPRASGGQSTPPPGPFKPRRGRRRFGSPKSPYTTRVRAGRPSSRTTTFPRPLAALSSLPSPILSATLTATALCATMPSPKVFDTPAGYAARRGCGHI